MAHDSRWHSDCEELLDLRKECIERDKISADKVQQVLGALLIMSRDFQSALATLAENHIYSDDADPGLDCLQERYLSLGKAWAKE